MRRVRSLLLIPALACSTLAPACGDDTAPDGPPVRELPELYAESLCPEVTACLGERFAEQFFGPQGCEGVLTAQGQDGDLPALQSAIDDGRVDYDASKVEPCLAELEGIGCGFNTTRSLRNGACDAIFTGTAELGEPCDVDEECKGAAFCQKSAMCPGECVALLGPGDVCDEDAHCEEGLRCADDGTCAAGVAEGGVCGGDVGGQCAPGLLCIGANDSGASGECMTAEDVFVGSKGEACDLAGGTWCKSPLVCAAQSISTTGGMVQIVASCDEVVDAGEPCNVAIPSQCPIDQRCDADPASGDLEGVCVPLPDAGEPCVQIKDIPPCAPGLHCNLEGRCHPLSRLGQPCTSDDDCASKHCVEEACERPEVCAL